MTQKTKKGSRAADDHCGVARGPERPPTPTEAPVEHSDDVVSIVAGRMLAAMQERAAFLGGKYTPEEVGATHKFKGTATIEDVRMTPEEVSVVYRVTGVRDPDATARRSMAGLVRTWTANPHEYAFEHVGVDEYRVHVIIPWKAMRRRVADTLGEAFERMLPMAMAVPVRPRVDITPDAMRLLAGKIASRAGGDIPIAALRDVIAAAPGWAWEEVVADRDAQERPDFNKHALLRAIHDAPRFGARVENGRGIFWHYDRDLTEADVAFVLGSFAHAKDVGGEAVTDRAPGSVSYRKAEVVLDDRDAKHPVLHGSGHRVLVVEGLRVATPAWSVSDPRGVRSFIFRLGVLYPRPPMKPARGHVARVPRVELAEPGNFWGRAYAAGLGLLGDGMLASFEPDELERLMYRMRVKDWGNTGECQLCANVQKLRVVGIPGTKVLVDHGYHYPDSDHVRSGLLGQRDGSCEAVGVEPYERSCTFLRNVILPRNVGWLEAAERRVADTIAHRDARKALKVPANWLDRHAKDDAPPVELKASHPEWKRAMALTIATAERDMRHTQAYVGWLKRRVDRWMPRPLYDELDAARKQEMVGAGDGT